MAITTTPLGFKKPDRRELVPGMGAVISDNAQKAQDLLARVLPDVAALKALGGLTPGDVSDTVVATLVGNPETDTGAAVGERLAIEIQTAGTPANTALSAAFAPLVEIIATPERYPGLDLSGEKISSAPMAAFIGDIAAAQAAGNRVKAVVPPGYIRASGLGLELTQPLDFENHAEFIQATNAPILRFFGKWGATLTIASITTVQRNFQEGFRDQARITFTAPHGLTAGDVVKVFSDDLIPEARPASGGAGSRIGESGVVIEASGNDVYLMGPLSENYITNPRAARWNTGAKLRATGLSGHTPDSGMATWTASLFSIECLYAPEIDRPKISQGCGPGIAMKSLLMHTVRDPDIRHLKNNGGGGQYGYAILDGSCELGLIDAPFVQDVRHGFTDDTLRIQAGDPDPGNYGRSRYSSVVDGKAIGVTGSAWDTHHAGEGHTFINCTTIGSGSGVNARGRFHQFIDCHTRNSRTGFQAIEELVGGITYGIDFINCTTTGAVFEAITANARTRNDKTMVRIIGGRHSAKGRALTAARAKVELDGGVTLAARAGSAVSNGELVHLTDSEIAVISARLDWSPTASGVGQTFLRLADATSSVTGRNADVIIGGASARVSSFAAGNPEARGIVSLSDVRFDSTPATLFADVAPGSTVAKTSPITFAPAEISSLGGSPTGGSVGSAGDVRFPVFLMDAATSEDVGVSLSVPSDWKLMNVSVVWANTATSVGDVKWTLNRTQAGPGEDATVRASFSAVDSAPATAGPLKYTTVASSLPVDPSKMQVVRIRREGSDTGDTLPNDAGLAQIVVSRVA